VARHGRRLPSPRDGLTHLFPTPAALAAAEPADFGVPRARAEALRALARGVAAGELRLAAGASVDATVAELRRLPGFGPWTAQYVAMRACGEPDAFPAGDLGVRRALSTGEAPASLAEAEARAEAWRPWRAYAVMHLWASAADAAPSPVAAAATARRGGSARATARIHRG
jgi:AraC family transcriptional regulator of adaptative response / DNA-3-methyladenine glycosylase II